MKLLSADTIRRCLIADPGHVILSADFDQIELRIAAALAGEQALIDAAKRGESLHKIAAVNVFGVDYTPDQYRFTKNLNFGWLYGGGPATLSEQTGVDIQTCFKLVKDYEKSFPALTAYKRRQTDAVVRSALTTNELRLFYSLRSKMYSLRSDTREGRQAKAALNLQIDRLLWRKTARVSNSFGRALVVDAAKAYSAVNYLVQSDAADVLKVALLKVMADPELEPTVLLPVHDELLGQAPRSKAEYIAQRYGEVMSVDFQGVPLTASGKVYGKSWGHGYANKA